MLRLEFTSAAKPALITWVQGNCCLLYTSGHGGDQIEAYFARPLGPGPFGGVVVIHHMPGYDEGTKEITRKFAAHGYNAICVNLYTREAPGASPEGFTLT